MFHEYDGEQDLISSEKLISYKWKADLEKRKSIRKKHIGKETNMDKTRTQDNRKELSFEPNEHQTTELHSLFCRLSLYTILFLYLHRLYIIEWDTNFPQEIWNLYSWGSQPKQEFIIWAK